MQAEVSYVDKDGRLHIGWGSGNAPATTWERVTGWSYAPGEAPNHRERR